MGDLVTPAGLPPGVGVMGIVIAVDVKSLSIDSDMLTQNGITVPYVFVAWSTGLMMWSMVSNLERVDDWYDGGRTAAESGG
jgi:hypothetical protein